MNNKKNFEKKSKKSAFIIVIFPNILFFIVLIILIYLFFLFELPWLIFPGFDVFHPLRLTELIVGTLLLIIGLYIFTWGLTTLSKDRASGIEIGKTIEHSTLISDGAFAHCRHLITFGFLYILPGIGLIFDFIPLILMTPFYSPLLISLLYYEEKELLKRFGEKYKEYKLKVSFLIPRKIKFNK